MISIIVQEKVDDVYVILDNYIFDDKYCYYNGKINQESIVYKQFKDLVIGCAVATEDLLPGETIDKLLKEFEPGYWESKNKHYLIGIHEAESPKHYVNVYLYDREYGGPEEGGWWYNTYTPEFGVFIEDLNHISYVTESFQQWCNKENSERRSDVSSVLSEGKFIVCVEDHEAGFEPKVRPHYE